MNSKFAYCVKNQHGLGIIEIIVVVGIALTSFMAIFQLFHLEVRAERLRREELRAYALLAEEMEIIRSIRDEDWSIVAGLTAGTNYYVQPSGSSWVFTTTNTGPIDGFTRRWLVAEDVLRDGNSDIASVGSADPNTRKFSTYIEWDSYGSTKTKSLTMYLTNWQ